MLNSDKTLALFGVVRFLGSMAEGCGHGLLRVPRGAHELASSNEASPQTDEW